MATYEVEFLDQLLEVYVEEVDQQVLTPSTKATYRRGTEQFVWWVKGDFHPGIFADVSALPIDNRSGQAYI